MTSGALNVRAKALDAFFGPPLFRQNRTLHPSQCHLLLDAGAFSISIVDDENANEKSYG